MYAFTKSLINYVLKSATQLSEAYTMPPSIYASYSKRKPRGPAQTKWVRQSNFHIRKSPKDGITLLKFIYGQLYNDMLAYRYKLEPTDTFPLCGLPDSCTHIARECKTHNNQSISRHNAACQLTHATIRTAFKGGGTIYTPLDLRLISMDAGTKLHTTNEDIDDLNTPSPYAQYDQHSLPRHIT